MTTSLLERAVRRLGPEAVRDSLSAEEWEALRYIWEAWARPAQLPPEGDWLIWLLLAGRGYGKSRCGAEFVRREVETARAGRIALVAKTPADVRDVMIEGESGFLAISPSSFMPVYEPSKRRLTWPNGAMALAFSSHEPDQLRGPQFDLAWCDELAAWAYPTETWENLMLALRLGIHPRCVATTTPKPIALIRTLLKAANTVITKGTTYENRKNLADSFFQQVVSGYEGTRLGRQEIYAELLEDMPGALWKREYFKQREGPDMIRVVVAIDPAVSKTEQSDETGIVAAGRCEDGTYQVLADRSGRYTPDGWARTAISLLDTVQGDRIIGEVNNGGDMVEHTLRTVWKQVPYRAVHASRGKRIRAEPVAALYEQGKVFHSQTFGELEDQLCMWTPDSDESPDRMDALVWAITGLQGGRPNVRFL